MIKTMFQQKKCDLCDYVFAVKNGCDKLLYTYLEYENNLYMEKIKINFVSWCW